MGHEREAPATLKQKLKNEFREMLGIFAYLAFFLCALAAYSALLLEQFNVSYFMFGAALFNALVLSKVIMIGEYLQLGKSMHGRPVIVAAIVKAVLFALLMAVFHIVEEVIKNMIHGRSAAEAVRELLSQGLAEVLVRNLVFFGALVPFFLCREVGRIAGEHKFYNLMTRASARGGHGGHGGGTGG